MSSQEGTDNLLQRALHGDREALGELLDSHRPLMLVTARRYLRRHPALWAIHDPEDAVEWALAALWEQTQLGELPTIEDRDDLRGAFRKSLSNWVAAASKHASAHKWGGPGTSRSNRVDPSAFVSARPHARASSPEDLDLLGSRVPPPDAAAMAHEQIERLLSLLDKRERAVADLRVERLSIKDIATRLKLDEDTVRRTLRRIRRLWRGSRLLD
ncbi:MAG: RNA polymerase sigma factor [Isosphaeraceae bacterium]